MPPSGEAVLDIEYLANWEAECISRLENLLQSHEKARLTLDSHLESTVHPSSYSTQLVEQLQKEERAANQVRYESKDVAPDGTGRPYIWC